MFVAPDGLESTAQNDAPSRKTLFDVQKSDYGKLVRQRFRLSDQLSSQRRNRRELPTYRGDRSDRTLTLND